HVLLAFPTRRSSDLRLQLLLKGFREMRHWQTIAISPLFQRRAEPLRRHTNEPLHVLLRAKNFHALAPLRQDVVRPQAALGKDCSDRKSTRLNSSHVK